MTTTFEPTAVQIGTHNEWALFYVPHNNAFMARKGKKERFCNYRDGLLKECNDADADDARAKRKIERCEFTRWDFETKKAQRVVLSSFSAKGIYLKPVDGGEGFYLDRDKWNSIKDRVLGVIKDGTDTARLDAAVEGLRRAVAELGEAQKALVHRVTISDPGYGAETAEFHRREDEIRTAINKVNQ